MRCAKRSLIATTCHPSICRIERSPLTPAQSGGRLTLDERGESMQCTEETCTKKATHLIAIRRGRLNYFTFNFRHYREVCRTHGNEYSLLGYHLMKGSKK